MSLEPWLDQRFTNETIVVNTDSRAKPDTDQGKEWKEKSGGEKDIFGMCLKRCRKKGFPRSLLALAQR